jgi:hypothetical protein
MTRAAGMPLGDGSLAPGMLTVRIVRGDFSNNAADQDVTIEVTGAAAQTARTAADGRAQFVHLAVGASVRASATVDGQRLASETFTMPAESGVRLLLVAGDGPATASGPAPGAGVSPSPTGPGIVTEGAGAAPDGSLSATAPPLSVPTEDGAVAAIRMGLMTTTVLAIVLLAVRWRRAIGRRVRTDELD